MMTLDFGPSFAYVIRRAGRHLDALPDGDALAVDVGDRRVLIYRRADGWEVDGETFLPSRAAVLATLHQAAAAWLIEGIEG